MTTFNPNQQTALLEWLKFQKDAGLSLNEVIEGLIDGTLITPSDEDSSQPV